MLFFDDNYITIKPKRTYHYQSKKYMSLSGHKVHVTVRAKSTCNFRAKCTSIVYVKHCQGRMYMSLSGQKVQVEMYMSLSWQNKKYRAKCTCHCHGKSTGPNVHVSIRAKSIWQNACHCQGKTYRAKCTCHGQGKTYGQNVHVTVRAKCTG